MQSVSAPPQFILPNLPKFAYDFDTDGILRNLQTGEILSMRASLTGASFRRREVIRAICTQRIRQRLVDLGMDFLVFPMPGHPKLYLRVLHSVGAFTHTGPVLIVMQGDTVAQAGIWATRLLLHPNHGLFTGSQLELVRLAHERGYAVVLFNANECIPNETESRALDLLMHMSHSQTESDGTGTRGLLSHPFTKVDTCGVPTPSPLPCSTGETGVQGGSAHPSTGIRVVPSSPQNNNETERSAQNAASALLSLLLNPLATQTESCGADDPLRIVSQLASHCFCPSSHNPNKEDNNSMDKCSPLFPTVAASSTITSPVESTQTVGQSAAHHPPEISESQSLNESLRRCSPKQSTPVLTTASAVRIDREASLAAQDGPSASSKPNDPFPPVVQPDWFRSSDMSAGSPRLEVSVEDRLYGMWRHIVPQLASNKIVVWAHQQGGTALIHPFKPMPGLFPGFSRIDGAPTPGLFFQRSPSSTTSDRTNDPSGESIVHCPTPASTSTPEENSDRSADQVGLTGERDDSGPSASTLPGATCLTCGGKLHCKSPKEYFKRKRNPSASTILSLTRTLDAQKSMIPSGQYSCVCYPIRGAPGPMDTSSLFLRQAVDPWPRYNIAHLVQECQEQGLVGPQGLSEHTKRILRERGYDLSPPTGSSSRGAQGQQPIGPTCSTAYTNTVCSQHAEPDSCNSESRGTDLCHGSVCHRVKIRLACAWQRKARKLYAELSSRIKAIVFTECPAVLNMPMEGVGWGLHLLVDQEANDSPGSPQSSPILFTPSVLQRSRLPARVTRFRKWLVEHSIHYVAADVPLGSVLTNVHESDDQIPVISSGTTEHDLIPSTVCESAMDFFDQMLASESSMDSESNDKNGKNSILITEHQNE